MSATSTPLLEYVKDLERRGIPPFRHGRGFRIDCLATDLRQAALADDAKAVALHLRTTRLQRLWKVEDWLTCPARKLQHPRVTKWLDQELIAIGWRRPRGVIHQAICACAKGAS